MHRIGAMCATHGQVTMGDGADRPGERVAPEALILATELTPPRVRREHVPRRELLTRLRSATSLGLTLVAAPPGFGKTTLLAEWAASKPAQSVAWLSLDENDNDPARFFTYVAAALQSVEPGLGGRALAALRAPGTDLFQVVLPLFINDATGLDRELALVLDDST